MENENINNELPKEIKAENENINPLLDIISSIQEKLDNSSQTNNATNSSSTYNNQNVNFSNQNMNNSYAPPQSSSNSGFDMGKLFEMFGSFNNTAQKTTTTNSNPFMNLDMETMMRFGKIFSSMNRDDPRKNLLLSLKPFLRNDRQKNVDTYIFVLGILNVLDTFGSGDSDFNGII